MKKITLYTADAKALATVTINRARVLMLPPPDFDATATIKGLTNYSAGDVLKFTPAGDDLRVALKNYKAGKNETIGTFDATESAPRLLTLHDGKYITLTVEETDAELYTKAKAQAAADNERQDKYTAAAIFGAVLLVIFCAWYFNLAGFLCLLLCLVAL